MATAQQIEDLLAAVSDVNDTMSSLDRERDKLQGYRDTRQQYATLVDAQKIAVDALVANSEAALRNLRDKITAVFP